MAIEICGQLSENVVINCDFPIQAGTEDTLILINRKDIISTTRNGTDPEIVEAIILASSKTGYVFQGLNNSIGPKFSMVKLKHFKRWLHEIAFIIFGISSVEKQRVQELKDADVVAIVYNKSKGEAGVTAFELYGLDAGLRLEVAERDVMNADTQGGFSLTLMTDKDAGLEPFPPKTIFITDYATTLALVEALYVP